MKKLIKKYQWGNIMISPIPGTTPSNSDQMGNINYYNYQQSQIPIIKQKDAERKAAEAREVEERRRGTIGPDRNPKTYKEREADSRRNEINYMVQTNPYHQWISDPNGTGSMQAAVKIMPQVIETTQNYFNRPVGEILKGEARALNHAVNPLMVTDDAFQRSKHYMQHGQPVLGMLSGFGGFGLGALSAFPFATPIKSGIGYTVNAGRKLGRQIVSDYTNWVNSNISQGLSLGNDLGFAPQFQVAGTNFNLGITPNLTLGRFNTMNSVGQNLWNTFRGRNKPKNVAPDLEAPTGNEASLGKLASISNKNGNVPIVYKTQSTERHFLDGKQVDPKAVTKENVTYITDKWGNDIYNPELTEREIPGTPGGTFWVDQFGNKFPSDTPVYGKKGKKYINGEGNKKIKVTEQTFLAEEPRTVYEYNGEQVTPINTTAYKYNDTYYPETSYGVEKTLNKTRLNVGDDLPQDAVYWDPELASYQPIKNAIFRRPGGRAWNRWTYANGQTPKGFKNPWILRTTVASPFVAGLVVGRKPIFNFMGNRAYSIKQGTGLFGPGKPPVNNNPSAENINNSSTNTPDTTTTTLPAIDTAAVNAEAERMLKEYGY